MTIEVVDQASGQSMTDRVANSLGISLTDEPEAVEATEVNQEESTVAELDWEGQKIQVPKALKDAFMKNEDYTRKTQELASQRTALEQVRSIAETGRLDSAFASSIAAEQNQLSIIDAYLAQASKVNWSEMTTDQMLRHKVEIDNIKEQRQSLMQSVAEKKTQFQEQMRAKLQELRGKTREIASKAIDGYSEQTEKDMRSFASSQGLAEGEIDSVLLDPRSYQIVWKAMQFDKVKASTGKVVEAAQKVIRPGAASNRMPADVAQKLNFNKAMKNAQTSGQKAQVIEQRLAGIFK
jgi:hypothetical protein